MQLLIDGGKFGAKSPGDGRCFMLYSIVRVLLRGVGSSAAPPTGLLVLQQGLSQAWLRKASPPPIAIPVAGSRGLNKLQTAPLKEKI